MKLTKLETIQLQHESKIKKTRRIVEKSLSYVPVILMGILAMLSYWLVKNTPEIEVNRTRIQPKHEIDYELRNFSVRTYRSSGELQSLLIGENAKHYADTETLEIEMPQVQVLDQKLNKTTATSSRAISNADGSELQMIGGAVLIKSKNGEISNKKNEVFELRSEYLSFQMDNEIIKSHLPVQISKESNRFSAMSMDFDNLNQTLKLSGRVHGFIESKRQ
jgi:lipopolysaccharide export system protein LptC